MFLFYCEVNGDDPNLLLMQVDCIRSNNAFLACNENVAVIWVLKIFFLYCNYSGKSIRSLSVGITQILVLT